MTKITNKSRLLWFGGGLVAVTVILATVLVAPNLSGPLVETDREFRDSLGELCVWVAVGENHGTGELICEGPAARGIAAIDESNHGHFSVAVHATDSERAVRIIYEMKAKFKARRVKVKESPGKWSELR
jgi:hypothetical protein